MKFIPYGNIKTNNLSLLLVTARLMAVFGLIIVLFLAFIIFYVNYSQYPMHSFRIATNPLVIYFYIIVTGFAVMLISGLAAAVVSCEYKYTQSQDFHQEQPGNWYHVIQWK